MRPRVVEMSNNVISKTQMPSVDKEEYVSKFLHWLALNSYEGWMSWRKIRDLAFEFSDFLGVAPLSSMLLSKVLKRYEFPKRQRYLKQEDHDFRIQLERGCQRPRVLEIKLPPITASVQTSVLSAVTSSRTNGRLQETVP